MEMNIDEVIVKPTHGDLTIIGYLKKIEINMVSFTVYYELYIEEAFWVSYKMHSKSFPLRYLPKFFKINAKLPLDFYCPRVAETEPTVTYLNGETEDQANIETTKTN